MTGDKPYPASFVGPVGPVHHTDIVERARNRNMPYGHLELIDKLAAEIEWLRLTPKEITMEYWDCGDLPWPDIEQFIDQNVGEALKHYIVEDGYVQIWWGEEPEPMINFTTCEGEFETQAPLYKSLVDQIGLWRPGGADNTDLFFDPEGDRRAILLQELLRTYLKWKEGGVYVPSGGERMSDYKPEDERKPFDVRDYLDRPEVIESYIGDLLVLLDRLHEQIKAITAAVELADGMIKKTQPNWN